MYPIASQKDGGPIGVMRRSRQLPIIPIWKTEKGKCISVSDTVGNLPLDPGTYRWHAIAKFEVQGAKFNAISGWTDKAATHHSIRGGWDWTIVHQKICPACKKPVKDFSDHIEATCTKTDWCNEANVYSCVHVCSSESEEDEDEEEVKTCTRMIKKRVLVRDRRTGRWKWAYRWRKCGKQFTDSTNKAGSCQPSKKHIE